MCMNNLKFSFTRVLLVGLTSVAFWSESMGQEVGDIVKLRDANGHVTLVGVYCGEYNNKAAVICFHDSNLTLQNFHHDIDLYSFPTASLLRLMNENINIFHHIDGFDPIEVNSVYYVRENELPNIKGFKLPDTLLTTPNTALYRHISYYHIDLLSYYANYVIVDNNQRIIIIEEDDEDLNSVSTADYSSEDYDNNINQSSIIPPGYHHSNHNPSQNECPENIQHYNVTIPPGYVPNIFHHGHHRLLHLYDSFGDGWNGGAYEISDADGSVVAIGTLESGHYATEHLFLNEGCYAIRVDGGEYPEEISWSLPTDEPTIGTSNLAGGVGSEILSVGNVDCNLLHSEAMSCGTSEVLDCDGSLECFPRSWIGDGYCDGPDQKYNADLSCHDNDGGDCEATDCHGKDYKGYEDWIGDGACDDGTWGFYFNCAKFNNDEGDCMEEWYRSSSSDSFIEADLNPKTNILTINFKSNDTEKKILKYHLYNSLGNIALQGVLNEGRETISTNHLTPGVYVLKILTHNTLKFEQFKFVKN